MSSENNKLCKEAVAVLNKVWKMSSQKAAEDLTIMSGENFHLSNMNFQQVPLEDIPDLIGNPEQIVSVVMLEITGKCKGEILLILPEKSADELVSILFGNYQLSAEEIEENRQSALRETGNILGSAFLNSIAAITDMEVLPTVPVDAKDMTAAIMDIIQIKYASIGDQIFVAESALMRDSKPMALYLLAIFEPESLAEIVKHSNRSFLE